MKLLLISLAGFLWIKYLCVPRLFWNDVHALVHVFYIFFFWEPRWLRWLHDWTGEKQI